MLIKQISSFNSNLAVSIGAVSEVSKRTDNLIRQYINFWEIKGKILGWYQVAGCQIQWGKLLRLLYKKRLA